MVILTRDISQWHEWQPMNTLNHIFNIVYDELPERQWHICAERYTPQGDVLTPQLDAIEVNGTLRWIASRCNATFELQPRAEAKKIAPDSLLKRLGVYTDTKDGHSNDAWRHALLWLMTHHPVEYLLLTDGV